MSFSVAMTDGLCAKHGTRIMIAANVIAAVFASRVVLMQGRDESIF
jgi:hypothetical protein